MSRSRIMARVRRGLKNASVCDLPMGQPAFPRYADRVGRFREELETASGVFLDGRDEESLKASLSFILEDLSASEMYWEEESIFAKHKIPYRLRDPLAYDQGHLVYSMHFRSRLEFPLVLHSRRLTRDRLASVPLSASSARWGIAETGTIVHQVGPGKGRRLSVLPPAHVAFLSETALLENCFEFFATTRPGDQGSAMTLVTGPSRTADIEKTLVTGVHGPKHWYVVLTD